jgi:branched-chain amino acid transport system ATP-binding protein
VTDPAAVLEVEGLHVLYGRVPAVRGLTFAAARGEVVGIVGPNGAGKSTTLHAIMGVVPSSGGSVRLAGRPLTGLPPEAIARSGVALVPEGRHIFGQFTVEENLRLGLIARRTAGAIDADLERVYELFPVVGEFRARQAGALSGGQQQQLAIARALVARPDVLLLDEPSLGLAPAIIERIFKMIAELKQSGLTILLVEQNAAHALAIADRAYVLRLGEVAASGPAAEIRAATDLKALYLGG